MNILSCIEINIDQSMKELLWFEDALANGYQDNFWYSKIIVFKRLLFYNLMMRWRPIAH